MLPCLIFWGFSVSLSMFPDSLTIVVIISKLIDFVIAILLIAITLSPIAIFPFLCAEPSGVIWATSKCPGPYCFNTNPKEFFSFRCNATE